MASQVSICNLALGWLGTNAIIAIDDETVEAKLCKANYEDAIKAVLEDRDWTFAIDRFTLTPEDEQPEFGFSFSFIIPQQVRRVISCSTDRAFSFVDSGVVSDVKGAEVNWQKEGNRLVANENTLFMRAVVDVFDPLRYPSTFVHCAAARLAADLAIPLTHSPSLMQSMWSLYGMKLTTASTADGRQGRREQVEASRLTRARRLGYPLGY